jgi:hypothetical protein
MKERILITLDPSDVERLTAIAQHYDIARSALIRMMIRSWKPLDIPGAAVYTPEQEQQSTTKGAH